jgi:hypothetical protein
MWSEEPVPVRLGHGLIIFLLPLVWNRFDYGNEFPLFTFYFPSYFQFRISSLIKTDHTKCKLLKPSVNTLRGMGFSFNNVCLLLFSEIAVYIFVLLTWKTFSRLVNSNFHTLFCKLKLRERTPSRQKHKERCDPVVSTPVLYLRDPWFKSRSEACYPDWCPSYFCQSFQANTGIAPLFSPRPLPSRSCEIYHSLIILLFKAI